MPVIEQKLPQGRNPARRGPTRPVRRGAGPATAAPALTVMTDQPTTEAEFPLTAQLPTATPICAVAVVFNGDVAIALVGDFTTSKVKSIRQIDVAVPGVPSSTGEPTGWNATCPVAGSMTRTLNVSPAHAVSGSPEAVALN